VVPRTLPSSLSRRQRVRSGCARACSQVPRSALRRAGCLTVACAAYVGLASACSSHYHTMGALVVHRSLPSAHVVLLPGPLQAWREPSLAARAAAAAAGAPGGERRHAGIAGLVCRSAAAHHDAGPAPACGQRRHWGDARANSRCRALAFQQRGKCHTTELVQGVAAGTQVPSSASCALCAVILCHLCMLTSCDSACQPGVYSPPGWPPYAHFFSTHGSLTHRIWSSVLGIIELTTHVNW